MRLTHLAVFDVGAFGTSNHAHNNYTMLRKRGRELARGEGLKLLSCLSNIDEIYRAVGSKSFADTHSLRNAAGAHLFHGDLSCYLYSSAFPFRDIGVPRMFNASM